jgi:anti-sigma factor RsiW
MHEEILSQIGEFRRGELPAGEAAAVERHLASCSACRQVAARWKDVPVPAGFAQRVMDRLGASESPVKTPFWRLVVPVLETAAAVMIVAAFWHPERSWVNSDKSFAYTDRPSQVSSPYRPYPKEMRYE